MTCHLKECTGMKCADAKTCKPYLAPPKVDPDDVSPCDAVPDDECDKRPGCREADGTPCRAYFPESRGRRA